MQLMIDLDTEGAPGLRFAASLLLQLAAGKDGTGLPSAPTPPADMPAAPPAPPAPPPPPPLESSFPVPPPPPSEAPANIGSPTFISSTAIPSSTPPASNLLPAPESPNISESPAAPTTSEYDSAGMPWDGRIHQKGRGVKKDLTWKLQKGIDPGLVQQVVSELAAKRIAPIVATTIATVSHLSGKPSSASQPNLPFAPPPPPPPPPVQAYAPDGSLAGAVPPPPPPPPPASDPAPAAASVGDFRALLDKITGAKLDPVKVSQVVQKHGAPNLMALKTMPHLIADVSAEFDAIIAGYA